MSRIANYHDLSIYTSYKNSNSLPVSNKTALIPTDDRTLKSDNVSLSISDGGKNALKNSNKSSTPYKLTAEEVVIRDKDITATIADYKNRLATKQYKQNSKLFIAAGTTIDSEL